MLGGTRTTRRSFQRLDITVNTQHGLSTADSLNKKWRTVRGKSLWGTYTQPAAPATAHTSLQTSVHHKASPRIREEEAFSHKQSLITNLHRQCSQIHKSLASFHHQGKQNGPVLADKNTHTHTHWATAAHNYRDPHNSGRRDKGGECCLEETSSLPWRHMLSAVR